MFPCISIWNESICFWRARFIPIASSSKSTSSIRLVEFRISSPLLMRLCEENVFFSRHKGNCYADSKTPSEAGQRVTCVIFIIMSTEVWMESGLYWPPYIFDQTVAEGGNNCPCTMLWLVNWKRYRKRIRDPDPPTEWSDKSDQKVDNIVGVYNRILPDFTRQ